MAYRKVVSKKHPRCIFICKGKKNFICKVYDRGSKDKTNHAADLIIKALQQYKEDPSCSVPIVEP